MASDTEIKHAIQQIAAVKALLKTVSKNGVTIVKKASAELGEFVTVDQSVIAKRYSDDGIEKKAFGTEDEALGWITEKR